MKKLPNSPGDGRRTLRERQTNQPGSRFVSSSNVVSTGNATSRNMGSGGKIDDLILPSGRGLATALPTQRSIKTPPSSDFWTRSSSLKSAIEQHNAEQIAASLGRNPMMNLLHQKNNRQRILMRLNRKR